MLSPSLESSVLARALLQKSNEALSAEEMLRKSLSIHRQLHGDDGPLGDALLGLLNNLLDLSKAEEGRMELENIDFDLGRLIGQALRPVRPIALDPAITRSTAGTWWRPVTR